MKLSEGLQEFYKQNVDSHNLSMLKDTIAGLEIRLKRANDELYNYKSQLDLRNEKIKILLNETEKILKKLQSSKQKKPKQKLMKNIYEDLEILRK